MPQRGGGIQAHVMRSARFELNANCLVALLLLARLLPDMSAVPAISPWGEVHVQRTPEELQNQAADVPTSKRLAPSQSPGLTDNDVTRHTSKRRCRPCSRRPFRC